MNHHITMDDIRGIRTNTYAATVSVRGGGRCEDYLTHTILLFGGSCLFYYSFGAAARRPSKYIVKKTMSNNQCLYRSTQRNIRIQQ